MIDLRDGGHFRKGAVIRRFMEFFWPGSPSLPKKMFSLQEAATHKLLFGGNIFSKGIFWNTFLWDKGSQGSVLEGYFESKDCAVKRLTHTSPSVEQTKTGLQRSLHHLPIHHASLLHRSSCRMKIIRKELLNSSHSYVLCSLGVCVCVPVYTRLGRSQDNFKCHFSGAI